MSNNSQVIGALLVGAAAGAVLGLLFAPESGTDTRKKIVESATDIIDDLQVKIAEGKNMINDLKQNAMKSSEDLIQQGKEAYNNAMNKNSENVGKQNV